MEEFQTPAQVTHSQNRQSAIDQSLVPPSPRYGATSTSAATKIKEPAAFTLIELLVVIGIIGILAGLLFPVLARAKERAKGTQCLSNLGQMQIAWNIYADDHQGTLPVNGSGSGVGESADEPSWPAISRPELLPTTPTQVC